MIFRGDGWTPALTRPRCDHAVGGRVGTVAMPGLIACLDKMMTPAGGAPVGG
jgi:hypothetical protein